MVGPQAGHRNEPSHTPLLLRVLSLTCVDLRRLERRKRRKGRFGSSTVEPVERRRARRQKNRLRVLTAGMITCSRSPIGWLSLTPLWEEHGPDDPANVIQRSPTTLVVNCKNHVRSHGDDKSTTRSTDTLPATCRPFARLNSRRSTSGGIAHRLGTCRQNDTMSGELFARLRGLPKILSFSVAVIAI